SGWRDLPAFGTPGCAAGSAPAQAEPAPASPPPAVSAPAPAAADPGAGASAADRWRAAVEQVEQESPTAAASLKQAALLGLGEGEVRVQLPPGFHAQSAERKRGEIEAVFARFFGRPTRLALTIAALPAAPAAAAEAPPGAAAPSIAASDAAERMARSARVRDTARAHANIQEAVRVLDGAIDRIEEL
ncbi:DNA polymerase III subunit gamma/tau, partial [Anaeromyxobacter sp. Red801]